jgi:photosystem II stability/assembly factor-like uncharacterized protein
MVCIDRGVEQSLSVKSKANLVSTRRCSVLVAVAISTVTAVGVAGAGHETWGRPRGIYGARITSLAVDLARTQIVYAAAADAGVFKTTNGGRTWRPRNEGLEVLNEKVLAIDPQDPDTVYAGLVRTWTPTTGGVFKTTNGGQSWRPMNTGLGGARSVSAVAIDPQTPGTVYVGTSLDEETGRGGGVFKSTNGGRSWFSMTSGLGRPNVYALAIDPSAPETLYAGTDDGGVFKTIDGGRSWRLVSVGIESNWALALAVDPRTPTTVYAGMNGGDDFTGGVFKSIDGGETWAPASNGLDDVYIDALAIDPQNPATMYALGGRSVFKSTDGAQSWREIRGALDRRTSALAIDPRSASTVYVGTRGSSGGPVDGVFKSTDGGGIWRGVSTGIAARSLVSLAVHETRPSIYAATYGDGVFKSSDGGRTWQTLVVGDAWTQVVATDPKTPSTLYVGALDGMFKSNDGGRTWRPASNGLEVDSEPAEVSELAVAPSRPSTLYAGTHGFGVFVSTDGARTWRSATSGLGRVFVRPIVVDPKRSETVYAVGYAGGTGRLYKSTNSGRRWRPLQKGLDGLGIGTLAIDPRSADTLYAGVWRLKGPGGIVKSTDGGESWRIASAGLPRGRRALEALEFDPVRPATLYALVNGAVYRTTNGGARWRRFGEGLPALDFRALELGSNGSVLYAATYRGEIFEHRLRR